MFKLISLEFSWVKRLYDSSIHDWKLTPLHIITQKLGKCFLFHSNLYIDPKKVRQFPKYYQEILSKWSSNLSVLPKPSSTIASQIIWYNKHIVVDKRFSYNITLPDKRNNHVGQLFDTNGAMKPRLVFKSEFSLSKNSHFYWIQIIMPFQKLGKKIFINGTKITLLPNYLHYLTFSRRHINKKYQIYFLSKCNSKELYSLNDTKT